MSKFINLEDLGLVCKRRYSKEDTEFTYFYAITTDFSIIGVSKIGNILIDFPGGYEGAICPIISNDDTEQKRKIAYQNLKIISLLQEKSLEQVKIEEPELFI